MTFNKGKLLSDMIALQPFRFLVLSLTQKYLF